MNLREALNILSSTVYVPYEPYAISSLEASNTLMASNYTENPILVNFNPDGLRIQYVLMNDYDPNIGKWEYTEFNINKEHNYIEYRIVNTKNVSNNKFPRLRIQYPITEEEYFQQSTVQDFEGLTYEEVIELPNHFTPMRPQ